MTFSATFPRAKAGLAALALMLAGCAAPPPPATPYDPDEANNRGVHEFNKGVDRAIFSPTSQVYGNIVPAPIRRGVSNFAANLDLPADVLNGMLQGRPGPALENTFRFAINSTIGIGGLFNPAGAMGVNGKPTDFGETLHVWGVPEGAYHELPVLGPSTDRDTLGRVVDFAMNPVRIAVPDGDGRIVIEGAALASTLGDRSQYATTINSILYESADSYAQLRLLYLQNRRYQLGQSGGEDDFVDPYADESFIDPYAE